MYECKYYDAGAEWSAGGAHAWGKWGIPTSCNYIAAPLAQTKLSQLKPRGIFKVGSTQRQRISNRMTGLTRSMALAFGECDCPLCRSEFRIAPVFVSEWITVNDPWEADIHNALDAENVPHVFSEKPAEKCAGWTEWYEGDAIQAVAIAIEIGLRGVRYA